jgi:hypothetical protein
MRTVLRSLEDVARSEQDFAPCDQEKAIFAVPVATPAKPVGSLRFASTVALTKKEVFEVCERLASVERVLLENGYAEEAALLGLLFDDLEDRLAVGRDMAGAETPRAAIPLSYASA